MNARKQWESIANDMKAVLRRCDEIINSLGGHQNDSRAAGFMRVRGVTRTMAKPAHRANVIIERPEGVAAVMAVWGVCDEDSVRVSVRDFDLFAKIGFLAAVQFYLENMIQTTLNAVPGTSTQSEFGAAAKEILKVAAVQDQERKLQILNVLAMIRNTMHREGVQSWPDETVVVGNYTYEFKKGEAIVCSSWPHIYNALLHSLDVYEEIMLSHRIRAVAHVPLVA